MPPDLRVDLRADDAGGRGGGGPLPRRGWRGRGPRRWPRSPSPRAGSRGWAPGPWPTRKQCETWHAKMVTRVCAIASSGSDDSDDEHSRVAMGEPPLNHLDVGGPSYGMFDGLTPSSAVDAPVPDADSSRGDFSREQMAPRRTSAGSPIRRDSVSLRRVRSRRPLGRSPV